MKASSTTATVESRERMFFKASGSHHQNQCSADAGVQRAFKQRFVPDKLQHTEAAQRPVQQQKNRQAQQQRLGNRGQIGTTYFQINGQGRDLLQGLRLQNNGDNVRRMTLRLTALHAYGTPTTNVHGHWYARHPVRRPSGGGCPAPEPLRSRADRRPVSRCPGPSKTSGFALMGSAVCCSALVA